MSYKTLSKNALKLIVEANKGSPVKDDYFLVQVIENRKKEGNSNIKYRLTLSDGTSSLITMVTDKFDAVEVRSLCKSLVPQIQRY